MAEKSFADALNEQSPTSSPPQQQYIAIAVHYDAETLPQLAAFFYRQAVEERNHAMMIIQYLLDAGHPIEVPGIEAPQTTFADGVAPVQLALEQEKRVSEQIATLAELAREEGDYQGEQFMQWFIKEQVEEVSQHVGDLLKSSSARRTTRCSPRSTWPARSWAARRASTPPPRPPPAARSSADSAGQPQPSQPARLRMLLMPAELGDVLAQGGGGRGGKEAGRQRRLGDPVRAGRDAVGAGAAAGGDRGGRALALPEQAGVVVEAVAARHPVADRVEVGGAALRLVVVVDAEAAAEQAEPGGRLRACPRTW